MPRFTDFNWASPINSIKNWLNDVSQYTELADILARPLPTIPPTTIVPRHSAVDDITWASVSSCIDPAGIARPGNPVAYSPEPTPSVPSVASYSVMGWPDMTPYFDRGAPFELLSPQAQLDCPRNRRPFEADSDSDEIVTDDDDTHITQDGWTTPIQMSPAREDIWPLPPVAAPAFPDFNDISFNPSSNGQTWTHIKLKKHKAPQAATTRQPLKATTNYQPPTVETVTDKTHSDPYP